MFECSINKIPRDYVNHKIGNYSKTREIYEKRKKEIEKFQFQKKE